LNRIRVRAEHMETVEYALQQFEAMSEFSEEISQIAQEIGLNITKVEELIAEATSIHLEVLAGVYDNVPEQAQPAIEGAMANLQIRHQNRVQTLEQSGGEVPSPPVIPERIQERVEERIREQEKIQEQQMEGTPGGITLQTPGVPAGAYHQSGPATT